MPSDFHTAYPAPARPQGFLRFVASWGERIATVLAVSLGVLAVALIAVVMGMA